MIQSMVHGFALFHVDKRHEGEHRGDDEHALILKLRELRRVDFDQLTGHVAIGQIRLIDRVYSTKGVATCGPWQLFIEVTADTQDHLRQAFELIDRKTDCHMDGFGF